MQTDIELTSLRGEKWHEGCGLGAKERPDVIMDIVMPAKWNRCDSSHPKEWA